jgi:hypothetical protein
LENLEVIEADFDSIRDCPGGLDTALLFDGLQRSPDPKHLLSTVASCLEPGGKILIQVPAGAALFGPTDRAAGHVRRFERDELEDLIRSAGLELMSLEPFNRLGYFGWRLHHALGAGRISAAEARSFDLLVPLARRLDPILGGPGLSWLAVARVP